jgi:hypothetical protein
MRMSWAGHVVCVGKMISECKVLIGKPERKRPLGRPRRRWENNVKMDLWEIGFGVVDCINLTQGKWQGTVAGCCGMI